MKLPARKVGWDFGGEPSKPGLAGLVLGEGGTGWASRSFPTRITPQFSDCSLLHWRNLWALESPCAEGRAPRWLITAWIHAGSVFLAAETWQGKLLLHSPTCPSAGSRAGLSPAQWAALCSQHSCSLSDFPGCSMGRFVPRSGSDNAGEPQGVRCSQEEPGLAAGTAIKEPLFLGGCSRPCIHQGAGLGSAWHLHSHRRALVNSAVCRLRGNNNCPL